MNFAPKTTATAAGGATATALVTILDWILGFWHVSLTAAVAAAFTTVLATILSYYAPSHQQPPPPPDDPEATTIP